MVRVGFWIVGRLPVSELVPAHLGGASALTTDTVVGSPEVDRSDWLIPGTEELAEGEIRVSILGSGLPWVTKSQAAGSVLMEVGTQSGTYLSSISVQDHSRTSATLMAESGSIGAG
jgi:hypothetical protein